jgi:hypothetical protein
MGALRDALQPFLESLAQEAPPAEMVAELANATQNFCQD